MVNLTTAAHVYTKLDRARVSLCVALLVLLPVGGIMAQHSAIIAERNGVKYPMDGYIEEASRVIQRSSGSYPSIGDAVNDLARRLFYLDLRAVALKDLCAANGIIVSDTEARKFYLRSVSEQQIEDLRNRMKLRLSAFESVVLRGAEPSDVFAERADIRDAMGSLLAWQQFCNDNGTPERIAELQSRIPASATHAYELGKLEIIADMKRENLRDVLCQDVGVSAQEIDEYREACKMNAIDENGLDLKAELIRNKREACLDIILRKQVREGLVIYDERFRDE